MKGCQSLVFLAIAATGAWVTLAPPLAADFADCTDYLRSPSGGDTHFDHRHPELPLPDQRYLFWTIFPYGIQVVVDPEGFKPIFAARFALDGTSLEQGYPELSPDTLCVLQRGQRRSPRDFKLVLAGRPIVPLEVSIDTRGVALRFLQPAPAPESVDVELPEGCYRIRITRALRLHAALGAFLRCDN